MGLKIYNTLTRKKEVFMAENPLKVKYYTCGPTVHDYAHIGNFRTFVFQDVLKRWLQYKGFNVKHVMNITDVDEKTIERAARKNVSLSSLTGKYEEAFFEDLDCLNIKRADFYPRVSENIDSIARMVKGLYDKGYVVKDDDGSYYYNINVFKDYGKLSGKTPRRKIRAKMPREDYNAPKFFLLWKACSGETQGVCWNTVIGLGIPGWHIECAALAGKYLGKTIDIHSGGVDLIFPHHENEIAEAEGYNGQQFSRFWVHVKHLIVYGRKMSKSLGNFFTLRQIINRGFDPRAIRLIYLKTHYRSDLDFNFERLQTAQKEILFVEEVLTSLNKIRDVNGDDYTAQVKSFKHRFIEYLDDDLKTDEVWILFMSFLNDVNTLIQKEVLSNTGSKSIVKSIECVNSIFGFLEECSSKQLK